MMLSAQTILKPAPANTAKPLTQAPMKPAPSNASNAIVSPRNVTPQSQATTAPLKNAPTMITADHSVSGVIPAAGPRATTITISGQKFGNVASDVQVKLNGISAIITGVSDNQITAVVPDKAGSGAVAVAVKGKWTSGGYFAYQWASVPSVFAGAPGAIGSADGTGVNARFNHPTGIARDRQGFIYIADCENNRIRKINNFGEVSTLAGSGEAAFADGVGTAAKFHHPYSLAVDAAGNILVADLDNYRIRKITPSGVVTTVAGNATRRLVDGVGAAAGFGYLYGGICVDTYGNIFVGDEGKIRKITPAGNVTTISGHSTNDHQDGPISSATFSAVTALTIAPNNDIYIADCNNSLIRKLSATGQVTTIAGSYRKIGVTDAYGSGAQFDMMQGIGMDAAGDLYVSESDPDTHPPMRIRRVSKEGDVSTAGGITNMGLLMGVIGDATNTMFVVDKSLNCIRKITFQ